MNQSAASFKDHALMGAAVTLDGHFVSQETMRIVKMIRDYGKGALDVIWLPTERRGPGGAEFAIIEIAQNGQRFVVFYVKDETDFTIDRYMSLIRTDMHKHGCEEVYDELNMGQRATDELRRRELADRMEARKDLLRFAITTPLHTIRHNGRKIRL